LHADSMPGLQDREGHYVCNEKGDLVLILTGAMDASLTPYQAPRSKLFVRKRFGKASLTHIDARKSRQALSTRDFRYPSTNSMPARQIIQGCLVPRI
jgi:hypothetical protein